ncbi:MAG: delta-class carbonic anhydrase [Granulosicoccus sp.]
MSNRTKTARNTTFNCLFSAALIAGMVAPASAQEMCEGYGPQTPRDISNAIGTNKRVFTLAPPAQNMNLCNIHTHTNAEHKGPGFTVFAGKADNGGYQCNETSELTEAELVDPANGEGAFHGVKPGDTIEVHWVHTSCDVTPGEGLGSCLSESCANPELRVEAQAFLVVNDAQALDFMQFAYDNNVVDGLHQAKSLPADTGDAVVFAGSTTGPKYTEATCSPLQVTWSVRPSCAKLDINSLNAWAEKGNIFNETKSHGVRQLVTSPELLSPIN